MSRGRPSSSRTAGRSRSRKPRMGQHILKDRSVLQSIIEIADLNEEDRVLEIGAGEGALTVVAAPRVKHLTALEVDERLCARLKERLKNFSNLDIVQADALIFDYETLPAPFKVIGNLPYYIATPLLMRLIDNRENITGMTLMFQEEVARRLSASPGNKDYGALTIRVQYYAEVEKILTIPPRAFSPPPKVKSALVKVTFLKSPRVAPRDQQLFFRVVKASFAHRRKTIRNSLGAALHPSVDIQTIDWALKEAGIEPNRRGESLGMEDFLSLSDCISEMDNRRLHRA